MERSDGKDPFNPNTYNKPAPSIQTMLELRAFCADFFQKRIRSATNTDNDDVTSFLALINYSLSYFARARAVIPELQAPGVECSNPNHEVEIFLYATRDLRGPPLKKWDFLPEEQAWAKLVKEGMKNLVKNLANEGMGHEKRLSDAGARGSPMNPTVLAPGKTEPPHLPMSVENNPRPLPKKLDLSGIPTFVPQNTVGSEELVWSPNSGTRPRRPDEIYQQSTKGRPATPLPVGLGISLNVTPAYSMDSQHRFHGSRNFSDSPTKGHRHSDSIRMPPPSPFKSTQSPLNPSAARASNPNLRHRRHNHSGETPFPGSIDQMMEMTTLSPNTNRGHTPSSSIDRTVYPANEFSRTISPSQFRGPRYPSSQARGVYGAEPFSAPPSVPGYGNLHQTGQGMHGGPPSPFHGQPGHFQARPVAAPLHPFGGQVPHVPNPQNWTPPSSRPHDGPFQSAQSSHPHDGPFQSAQSSHPHHGPFQSAQSSHSHHGPFQSAQSSHPHHAAFQNQMPDQIIQPIPQRMAQAQIPPFITQAPPNSDPLVVPPRGSMLSLDYWNMLHQREIEIRTRLENANRPMTTQEHQYISLLAEARIKAAATQMPNRGNRPKEKWVAELTRTLRRIWEGESGFNAVVVARKTDFEEAVKREIAAVTASSQMGRFESVVDRTYGA